MGGSPAEFVAEWEHALAQVPRKKDVLRKLLERAPTAVKKPVRDLGPRLCAHMLQTLFQFDWWTRDIVRGAGRAVNGGG